MSYFDDASLVMIPSGYKTSKVYSVKPTDGTGDLTFSRSNDTATRVNSAGLIEKVRTNLVPNGLLFNGATGVLYTTVTSDSPISGVSSTRITKNEAAGTLRYGNQTVSASVLTGSISYTISRYFKYDGYNLTTSMEYNSSLNWGGTSWVQDIDIASTGVTLQAPSNCTSKITNVGNGWYRVDVTIVNGASPVGNPTHLLKVDSTLSTGQGFLTAAPQLETGDIATSYIATTSAAVSVGPVANVPRLDYLNSSCPRLLLEPQRTNDQTYSEDFSQGKYTKTDCTISSNVTATVDPAGYNGSDKLVEAVTVGGQHYIFFSAQTGANQETQISIFAKAAGRTEFLLWESAITNAQARFNLSNGTISASSSGNAANLVTTTPTITSYGNGWYRCTLNFKTASGGGTIRVQLYNGSTSYNGNGTDGIYIYGLQEEVNTAYATSYIPTLGAAVTRGADAATKTGISSLIGQTEGTIFAEIVLSNTNQITNRLFSIVGVTGAGWPDNSLRLDWNTSGTLSYDAAVSGASSFGGLSTTSYSAGQTIKVAVAYKSNDTVMYVNGVQAAVDTSTTAIPACSLFALNELYGFSNGSFELHNFKQALLFKTRLSNADLAALTA